MYKNHPYIYYQHWFQEIKIVQILLFFEFFSLVENNSNRPLEVIKGWSWELKRGDPLIEVKITVIKGKNLMNLETDPLTL